MPVRTRKSSTKHEATNKRTRHNSDDDTKLDDNEEVCLNEVNAAKTTHHRDPTTTTLDVDHHKKFPITAAQLRTGRSKLNRCDPPVVRSSIVTPWTLRESKSRLRRNCRIAHDHSSPNLGLVDNTSSTIVDNIVNAPGTIHCVIAGRNGWIESSLTAVDHFVEYSGNYKTEITRSTQNDGHIKHLTVRSQRQGDQWVECERAEYIC
jgi:hypothetical protein